MKRAHAPLAAGPTRPPALRRSLPKFSFDEAPTKPRGATVALGFVEPDPAEPAEPARISRPTMPAVAKARRPTLQKIAPRPPRGEVATIRASSAPPAEARASGVMRVPTSRPPPLPEPSARRPPPPLTSIATPETAMPFPLTRVKGERPPVKKPTAAPPPDDGRPALLPTLHAARRPRRWWMAPMVLLSLYVAGELVLAAFPAVGVAAEGSVESIGSFFRPTPR